MKVITSILRNFFLFPYILVLDIGFQVVLIYVYINVLMKLWGVFIGNYHT